ncbi:MAG TPA: hypothetical protein DEO89_07320 [Lachnospiraceae bacterium]|nr:hypothetical protein [Lachnospiraceae bacterium]
MNLKTKKIIALLCVAGGTLSYVAPMAFAGSASKDVNLNAYCKVHAYCNTVAGNGVDYASYSASILGNDADGVVVVSEYGTCDSQYKKRNNFTVNDGFEVTKGHKLSKTCTIWPWESNTHAYQIIEDHSTEIIRIKAKIN